MAQSVALGGRGWGGAGARDLNLGWTFLPELLISSGFFLIYLVEEAVEAVLGGSGHAEAIHRHVSVR